MNSYESSQITLINPSLIDPHPDNPRKNIGDVTDLAASIKANGLLSPLSVVPNGERYRVIAGHRRLAACRQAGTGAEDAHERLQTADWPLEAVSILAARLEWFIDADDWNTTNDVARRIPAYYQILQDLGYQPSDDETEHLKALADMIAETDQPEEDEETDE